MNGINYVTVAVISCVVVM